MKRHIRKAILHLIAKTFLIGTLIGSFSTEVQAQDSLQLKNRPLQQSDLLKALEILNIHIFTFDLQPFQTDTYDVVFYIDEQEQGEKPQRVHTFRLGTNRENAQSLSPEFRKYLNLADETEIWNKITDLSVFLKVQNDSTTMGTFKVPQAMGANFRLKLKPIANTHRYFYKAVPYALKKVVPSDFMQIPLIFYGSGWKDKNGLMRFCGERVIDVDDPNGNLLASSPHAYTIGIIFKKIRK